MRELNRVEVSSVSGGSQYGLAVSGHYAGWSVGANLGYLLSGGFLPIIGSITAPIGITIGGSIGAGIGYGIGWTVGGLFDGIFGGFSRSK